MKKITAKSLKTLCYPFSIIILRSLKYKNNKESVTFEKKILL